MILHWLVSQSIFYLLVVPYDMQNNPNYESQLSSLGYAPLPIFLSILIGGLMLCILFGLVFKRLKSHMPLAGACSAAISAACHPSRNENLDTVALGRLKWGEVTTQPAWDMEPCRGLGDKKGHCSFTASDTVNTSLRKLYV
jgi:hypothetical protein